MKKISVLSLMAMLLIGISNAMAKEYSVNTELLEKAKKGDTEAMVEIADQFNPDKEYKKPVDNQEKDMEIALEWYEKAAEKGSQEAAQEIGNYYYDKEDYSRAFYWYKEKGGESYWERGNDFSEKWRVAQMYLRGKGVNQDYDKALSYYKDDDITKELITKERQGQNLAVDYLTQQAENGNQEAMKLLAMVYWVNYHSMESAAQRIKRLGYYKAKEDRVSRLEKVRYWLEKYEEKTEDPVAQYWLGKVMSGAKSFQWYKKAAGEKHPQAQFEVAKAYYSGEGAIIDVEQAKKYAKLACENGIDNGCMLYNDALKYPSYSDMVKEKRKEHSSFFPKY